MVRQSAGEWIASEGRPVVTRHDAVGDYFRYDRCADREAVPQRFGSG